MAHTSFIYLDKMSFLFLRIAPLVHFLIISVVMAESSVARRNVVKTFVASTFTPRTGPFGLFTNKHWQTIIGSEALQTKFKGPYPR
jgi:hypothetical protein